MAPGKAPKGQTRRTSSTARGRRAPASQTKISVELFNVGFGDCFLLSFEKGSDRTRILIDCGVHSAGQNQDVPMERVVENIIERVSDTEDGEPYIDLVVCTHRHQDHISGFALPAWKNVAVGEVWLPWTEDPKDADALAAKSVQLALAQKLSVGLQNPRLAIGKSKAELDTLCALQGLAKNNSNNAKAMQTLQTGFSGKPKRVYWPRKGQSKNTFPLSSFPSVQVHVLAPSRDPAVIRKMNPPKVQSYIALLETYDDSGISMLPFRKFWSMQPFEFESKQEYWHLDIKRVKGLEAALAQETFSNELSAASWLDSAINGTSLVLMFEIGDEYLLFSGDAQWGTWKMMMEDPQTRDLLSLTTFYKVGHHLSHNGTPVEFVDNILEPARFRAAMASVQPVKQWTNIPRVPLKNALEEKTSKGLLVSCDGPPNTTFSPGNGGLSYLYELFV